MKKTIVFTLLLLSCLCNISTLNAQKVKLKKIFNGRDLSGWKTPQCLSCWTAQKGILDVKSNAERKGDILWSAVDYKDFIFQADFLMGEGVVDSGIFLRSENDQVQIGISGSLKRDMTGSPYIPKLRYPVEATGVKDILKPKDWNTMKIKVQNKTYTVWLNGKEVMTYTSEGIPEMGPIGIQLHPNNEMHIQYKNIKLAKL